jgi:dihydrodipicolinate reductase
MSDEKIKVALGGYCGKMGKVVERLIGAASDMELVLGIDPRKNEHPLSSPWPHRLPESSMIHSIVKDDLGGGTELKFPPQTTKAFSATKPDIYVDFTNPFSVVESVVNACELGTDVVIGTTGWYEHTDRVRDAAKANGRRVVYATNFSPGVNAMYAATELLARTLGQLGWDGGVLEVHTQKRKTLHRAQLWNLAEYLLIISLERKQL